MTNPDSLPDGSSSTVGAGATEIFDPGGTLSDAGGTPLLHDPAATPKLPVAGGTPAPQTPVPIDAAPVVTAIECLGETLVDANVVSFSVAFSKPVTGLETSDFAVEGDATGTVTSVSEVSYSQWTVTVSGVTGSGTLGLEVVDGGTITDWYGTPLDAAANTGQSAIQYQPGAILHGRVVRIGTGSPIACTSAAKTVRSKKTGSMGRI